MAIHFEDQTEKWKEEFAEVIKYNLDPTILFVRAKHRKILKN